MTNVVAALFGEVIKDVDKDVISPTMVVDALNHHNTHVHSIKHNSINSTIHNVRSAKFVKRLGMLCSSAANVSITLTSMKHQNLLSKLHSIYVFL